MRGIRLRSSAIVGGMSLRRESAVRVPRAAGMQVAGRPISHKTTVTKSLQENMHMSSFSTDSMITGILERVASSVVFSSVFI